MPTNGTPPSDGAPKSLVRGFPVKRFAVAALLLITVAIMGFISLERVKGKAALIVGDTLPGLADAGMANAALSEDFNHTLLMAMTGATEEQARYREASDRFAQESKRYLDQYEKSIFSPGDRINFIHLLERRKDYLETRQQVYGLVSVNKRPEALALCRESLLPAYKSYKAAGELLLAYNVHQGESRGDSILRFCRFTQYAVAGCVIALFVLGFIIGVFK